MKDLSKLFGFEVKLKSESELVFGSDVNQDKPEIRFEDDLKGLTYNKELKLRHKPIYYMYRNRHKEKDEKIIRRCKVRYDITLIPPLMIGKEFVKTSGHFHPEKPGTKIAYPEVYEVVSGQALYLLIGSVPPYNSVTEVYLCEVNSGEKAIMPPNFGHITINVKNEPLLMTNWVAEDFNSIYGPFEEKHGGTHFLIKNTEYRIIKNNNWGEVPRPKIVRPKNLPGFGLKFGKPMYVQGISNPQKLKYLTDPEKFIDALRPNKIFK